MTNDAPRAIRTNGIGRRSDYHINITRSLADVWRETFASEQPSHPSFVPKSVPEPKRQMERAL